MGFVKYQPYQAYYDDQYYALCSFIDSLTLDQQTGEYKWLVDFKNGFARSNKGVWCNLGTPATERLVDLEILGFYPGIYVYIWSTNTPAVIQY